MFNSRISFISKERLPAGDIGVPIDDDDFSGDSLSDSQNDDDSLMEDIDEEEITEKRFGSKNSSNFSKENPDNESTIK